MNYLIEITAHKEESVHNPYYPPRDEVKKVYVTEAEIFEAVSKYLQVKGFNTEVLSVREINEAEEEK